MPSCLLTALILVTCLHAVHCVYTDPLWKLKQYWDPKVQAGIKDAQEYDMWMADFTARSVHRGHW